MDVVLLLLEFKYIVHKKENGILKVVNGFSILEDTNLNSYIINLFRPTLNMDPILKNLLIPLS